MNSNDTASPAEAITQAALGREFKQLVSNSQHGNTPTTRAAAAHLINADKRPIEVTEALNVRRRPDDHDSATRRAALAVIDRLALLDRQFPSASDPNSRERQLFNGQKFAADVNRGAMETILPSAEPKDIAQIIVGRIKKERGIK